MQCLHSLCSFARDSDYDILYSNVNRYLKNGHAVICSIRDSPVQSFANIAQFGAVRDTENYIKRGALTIVDRKAVYSSKKMKSDISSILNALGAVVSKIQSRGKFKGIVIISEESLIFANNGDYDNMIFCERDIVTKLDNNNLEIICCYSSTSIQKMPLRYLLPILHAHNYTMHRKWIRHRWYPSKIIEIIGKVLDDTLGAGASNLVFKTLNLVYNIDDTTIISNPEIFENTLSRILGESTAETVIDGILNEIQEEMAYDTSAEIT